MLLVDVTLQGMPWLHGMGKDTFRHVLWEPEAITR